MLTETDNKPVHLRRILALALPVAVQQGLLATQGMVDVAMVSHLGQAAVGAVGLGTRIHFVLMLVATGLAMGSGILIAQYAGRGDFTSIRQVVVRALLLGTLLAGGAQCAISLYPQFIIDLASADSEIRTLSREYTVIVATSLVCLQFALIFEYALRAQGDALTPTLISAASVGINIVLNNALIFGHWGAPALGVAGAAWATAASRVLQLALQLGYLYATRHRIRLGFTDVRLALTWNGMHRLLVLSLPLLTSIFIWSAGNLMYHVIAGNMGKQALEVASLMAPIESIAIAIFVGLCSACSVLVGHRLGRSAFDQAGQLALRFLLASTALAAVAGIGLFAMRHGLAALLGHLDPETLSTFYATLAVLCGALWLKVANITLINGILRAGGDNRFSLILDLVSMWGIELPLAAILAFHYHLPYYWVFSAFIVGDIVKASLGIYRMRSRAWMRNLTHTQYSADIAPA